VRDDVVVGSFGQTPDAVEMRHLRSFVAVAEELSFVRAAQRLYISQPALSRQIRALERAVGCELFRRSTQRVELTLAGEALLARVLDLLAGLDDAITTARSVAGELDKRMFASWKPWIEASAAENDVESTRAAVEELHSEFTPPPEVRISSVVAGGVPALAVKPAPSSEARILYLHGGGYVAGSAFGYRHLAGAMASAAGATVIVIDYRLAPEHPFPAGLQDATDAYRWLLTLGVAPENIVIAGDSAGGGLAMSLLLALRQSEIPLPAGAALLCPWLDLTGKLQGPTQDSPHAFPPEMALKLSNAYRGGVVQDDPLLYPLEMDLTGLPPLLVQAGSGDSVFQEAQLLEQRAQERGVDVNLDIYPVASHAFQIFWSFLPEAKEAVKAVGGFVRRTTSMQATGKVEGSRG
jgi:epsilon-lactone hydrolase